MSKECNHEERKQVITATDVEIQCAARGCKEVVHKRTRVLSSNIYAAARVNKKVEIQFMNKEKGPGPVYVSVENVPRDVFEAFMKAKSKGAYFAAFMKEEYEFIPSEET